jgi:hypothetical protein
VREVEARVEGERLAGAPKFEAPRARRRTLVVALLALAAVLLLVVLRPEPVVQPPGPALAVSRGGKEDPRGLAVGKPLVTGAQPATVKLAYGEVTVEPNSTLRLVKFEAQEHRLALDRGTLEARVDAPPRLFNVDVPGGQVVDLGCAYRLTVRDDGSKEVEVETGYVELEGAGRRVTVPAGARTSFSPQGWPRTPVDLRASEAWGAALRAFEDAPSTADALARVALAEARDAVSLWNLLPRAEAAQRPVLSAKLKELSGKTPSPWSADDLAQLEPKAVEAAWMTLVKSRSP